MTWYHNNTRGEKPQGATEKAKHTGKGVKSFKKNYTAKGVAKDHFKDLILAHIQNLTDAKPGSPGWLKYYPAAHTAVFEGLDEDQLEECEQLAKEWNSNGPNPQKQAK
jgi:hypothetical protein